jgi:hypothetical protein
MHMAFNVRPAPVSVNAKESQGTPRQLRLPLMVREIGPAGLALRNTVAVEGLRLFLVTRSHLPAKLVARETGSRPTRIRNEDEGRVLFSLNTTVCRFLDLKKADREQFLERLRDLDEEDAA